MGWWPSMSGCRWRQRTDCMASLPRPGLHWSRRWQRPHRTASGCRWPKITAIWPQPLVERAIAPGQRYEARRAQLNGSADRPAIAAALTEKELALARLVAQRRTNKEIAETLHLSEGTVKQYINQLYAKLDIGGAVRNKRAQLAALFGTKY